MVTTIDNLIKEINSQIELNLLKKEDNQVFIIESFKKLNDLIEGFVIEKDPDFYEYYKYQYHIKYSIFLCTIEKKAESSKHQKISKKFEQAYIDKKSSLDGTANSGSNEKKQASDDFHFIENEDVSNDYYDAVLKKIDSHGLSNSEVILKIKFVIDELKKIKDTSLNNFTEYKILDQSSADMKFLIDDIILKLNDDDSLGNHKSIIENLDELRKLISKNIYSIEIDFMQKVIVSTEPEKLLFNELTVYTEENINRCYRKLALYFSPDRPMWINDENRVLANRVCQRVNVLKEKFINLLDEKKHANDQLRVVNDDILSYEKRGNELWEHSRDVKLAIEKQWDKLKHFSENSLKNLTENELEDKKNKLIIESYQQYRGACRIADKNNLINKQIDLRGKMSLCLYSVGDHLEAQLFAVASIQLVMQNSSCISLKQLDNARKILEKVKGQVIEIQRGEGTINSDNILALVKINDHSSSETIDENFSFKQRIEIQGKLNKYLGEIALQRIISCDKSLISYKAAEEYILKTRKKAKSHTIAGGVVATVGGIFGFLGTSAGAVVATSTGIEVLATLGLVSGTVIASPIVAIGAAIGGVALLVGSGIKGYKLIKEGKNLLKEPEIRERLNRIMSEAVEFHEKKQYREFIGKISEAYDKNKSLLTLNNPEDTVNTVKITESLIAHGFRPDGIAYLLNLIGEALTNGNVKIEGFTRKDLINKAMDTYRGILSKKLEDEAQVLDERITELRKKNMTSRLNEIKDTFRLKDSTWIAKEHVKDAQKMPFKTRLEELRNIAKLNIAIIRILNGEKDELDDAKKLIEQVRESIGNSYQFISKSNLRLDALEDFLWIITGQTFVYEDKLILRIMPAKQEENNEKYLLYLEDSLLKSIFDSEKIEIHKKIADHYEFKAKECKINKLNSLKFWQDAKNAYHETLKLKNNDTQAIFGFARCLLELNEYSSVFTFFRNKHDLSKHALFWLYCGITYRKCNKYDKAEHSINEALKRDANNAEAAKEKKMLEKLKANSQVGQKYTNDVEEDYYKNNQKLDEKKLYKILSIDGGGVRGVIPAFWLNEIERKTKKPISHLFNMVAGTSCGGIIAAGLSIPKMEKITRLRPGSTDDVDEIDRCSTYKPRYEASEILQLFKIKSKKIFISDASIFSYFNWGTKNMVAEKYTDTGRKTLFEEYFDKTSIMDSLIDIIIPAYCETRGNHTMLFDSRKYSDTRKTTFLDALMATSAAPTFFPSYKIGNDVFLDGGVNLNNPSMRAYSESKNGKNVFLLSMGTGGYIPDPLNPNSYRGKLFWAKNFPEVALNSQEGNVDIEMNNHSKNGRINGYQRWQVWMEKPISLDAFDEESLNELVEMGKQYIEEEEDQFNKLVDILIKDKEYTF